MVSWYDVSDLSADTYFFYNQKDILATETNNKLNRPYSTTRKSHAYLIMPCYTRGQVMSLISRPQLS